MSTTPSPTGAFIQLIEYSNDQGGQLQPVIDEWLSAIGAQRTVRWYITCVVRDDPTRFIQLVEFPDYAAAMANSDHPATAAFAESLRKLSLDPPSFRNLDVIGSARL